MTEPLSIVRSGNGTSELPKGNGRKDDQGKCRFSLLDWPRLIRFVRVMEHGAARYGDDNWKRVPDARRRYFDALQRHVTAWWQGEQFDPDSGEHHLAHVIACAFFAWWHDEQKSEGE